MKVKINNIFKNANKDISINQIASIKRRTNINQASEFLVTEEISKEEHREYRRKGAYKNRNIFYLLKKIKYKFSLKKSYYILFALMSMLAAISVYTNFLTYKDKNNESYEVFNSNDGDKEIQEAESSISEELQDKSSNNIDTRTTNKEQTVILNTTTSVNEKKNTTVKETVVPLSFVKPINGEIIKIYSVSELLFSKTLESWKTHDGVDVKANLGESVRSIEKGIIEKIYEDSFYGTTIIIDHGQGYKSIYSNLESKVNVSEKQVIKKSFAIGKLGKTSIGEIKDDPHVHFMLMFNNKVIDPTSKIKF
ncbi:MAG: rane protein [Clostridia bacterium]|jgi:murein DD-endopeptidase MepM/ murein hydrolase activator NlpD|nr:rane protein [Clostridia bacterium]